MNNSKAPNYNSERINYLDSMRGVAIIMVIGVHTLSYSITLPTYLEDLIALIAGSICVPIFFAVDGFLFSKSIKYKKTLWYGKFIKNSIKRLLVPWLLFTIIYTIARYTFEYVGAADNYLIIGYSWNEWLTSAYGSVYSAQMYFLLSLFIIRLCTPILRWIIIKNNIYLLIIILLIYIIVYKTNIHYLTPILKINNGQEPILHAFWGLPFYFLGIIVYKISENTSLKKLFPPLVLCLIFVLFTRNEGYPFIKDIYPYLYLLSFFSLFSIFHNGFDLLNKIGKNTMGIYLIHMPFILKGMSIILNKYIFNPYVSYFMTLFGTLIISYYFAMAINKTRYSSVLFGTTKKHS